MAYLRPGCLVPLEELVSQQGPRESAEAVRHPLKVAVDPRHEVVVHQVLRLSRSPPSPSQRVQTPSPVLKASEAQGGPVVQEVLLVTVVVLVVLADVADLAQEPVVQEVLVVTVVVVLVVLADVRRFVAPPPAQVICFLVYVEQGIRGVYVALTRLGVPLGSVPPIWQCSEQWCSARWAGTRGCSPSGPHPW